MSTQTIRNLSEYFTPQIVIMPAFSNHEDLLLNRVLVKITSVNQANLANASKHIVINQNKTNIPIEAIRDLISELSYGSFEGTERLVIIYAAELTSVPAQNALLKLLEEPPAQTRICLTVENKDKLLETIQSRCVIIDTANFDIENNDFDISTYKDIYSRIKTLSYREVIELTDTYKERADAQAVLQGLLRYLHQLMVEQPQQSRVRQHLNAVFSSITQLEKNVNSKLALENCFFELKKTYI